MQKQKAYALGIDLGGTKTLAAVIDITNGEVIASARKRTRAERGQDFVGQRTIELAQAALGEANLPLDTAIMAIGVGAAGQDDCKTRGVVGAPHLLRSKMQVGETLVQHLITPDAVVEVVQMH